MGGRGHLVVAAVLSWGFSLAPARAVDCPAWDPGALEQRAADFQGAGRERFLEQIALNQVRSTGFIGFVTPLSGRRVSDPDGDMQAVIVRYRVERPIFGPADPELDVLHTFRCDGPCPSRATAFGPGDLARLPAVSPIDVRRVPELAASTSRGRLFAAMALIGTPAAASPTSDLADVRFLVDRCPPLLLTGHDGVDRWVVRRLRWLLGVKEPAFGHWGPAPRG